MIHSIIVAFSEALEQTSYCAWLQCVPLQPSTLTYMTASTIFGDASTWINFSPVYKTLIFSEAGPTLRRPGVRIHAALIVRLVAFSFFIFIFFIFFTIRVVYRVATAFLPQYI